MKTFLNSIFCLFLLSQNGFSQNEKAAQFLGKCLVPETSDESNFDLPEWAQSDDVFMIGSTKERVEVTPASKKWVKKKADRNCLSAKPEDCLVWCLVEVPGTYKTSRAGWEYENEKSFLPQEKVIQEFLKNGYFFDWQKVLNPENLSDETKQKIISELKREGYLSNDSKGDFQTEVISALLKLQIDFGLPVGNLNFETLDFLEVEYKDFDIGKKRTFSTNRTQRKESSSYYRSSSSGEPPNAEAGKCYAKCLIADIWREKIYELPAYIGDPDDKTVKRKRKKIGGKEFIIVKKPEKVDQKFIEWKTIAETKIVQKGGFTEWREILCASKVTEYTIQQIQNALVQEGFLISMNQDNSLLEAETKQALREFQKTNELPIGNLDFETLDALGIDY